jgi:beta-aspartyl-peptidase (threonine type)
MLRFLTAKAVCDQVASGKGARQAVDQVLSDMGASVGSDVGIIAIDRLGHVGVDHLTPAMPHAFAIDKGAVVARVRAV